MQDEPELVGFAQGPFRHVDDPERVLPRLGLVIEGLEEAHGSSTLLGPCSGFGHQGCAESFELLDKRLFQNQINGASVGFRNKNGFAVCILRCLYMGPELMSRPSPSVRTEKWL